MRQFSLRTLLLAVIAIVLAVVGTQRYISYRADYLWPDETTLFSFRRPTTKQELAKFASMGSDALTASFRNEHPPRRLKHWKLEIQKIEPGMTSFALMRRIPRASLYTCASVEGLEVSPDNLICYAVDSKHGIVVQMSYDESKTLKGQKFNLGRVEKVIGIFEHDGELTDINTLPISFCNNLTLTELVAP